MSERDETLVLYSKLALYPVHWLALAEIVRSHRVRAVALVAPQPELPSVHRAHGTVDPETVDGPPVEVRRMPTGSRRARLGWLARQLREIDPDAIWVQEEPIDPFLLEILALNRFRKRPRIATAVCENIFPPPGGIEQLARRLLWPRLDRLLAVAEPSIAGIRAAGMPQSVPAVSLVVGSLEPPAEVAPLDVPRRGDGFLVGFAGRIVEEKGWRVLVRALERLPPEFALAVAGDGPQLAELRKALPGRLRYAGLLPKDELWTFYRALDALAVPSLTTPRWKEQAGTTLVDGLAIGLPVVGSTSGAIPEVMGGAGLLVPEGDAQALAAALERLRGDPGLRRRLGEEGRRRFEREFSIGAYAAKIAAALDLPPREVREASAERMHPWMTRGPSGGIV